MRLYQACPYRVHNPPPFGAWLSHRVARPHLGIPSCIPPRWLHCASLQGRMRRAKPSCLGLCEWKMSGKGGEFSLQFADQKHPGHRRRLGTEVNADQGRQRWRNTSDRELFGSEERSPQSCTAHTCSKDDSSASFSCAWEDIGCITSSSSSALSSGVPSAVVGAIFAEMRVEIS